MARSRHLLSLALLVLARPVLGADENPSGIRIIAEKIDDGVILRVASKYVSEFTVTLEADLENMTSSRPIPFTVDAAGRTSFVLVKFRRTDLTKRWHYHYQPYWQVGARRSSTTNDADYAIPFGPGRYIVLQGPRGTYSHFAGTGSENAVDWIVPEGTIVCAARDGRVVGVKQDSTVGGPDRKWRPFANYILIKHADGTFADYVHLQAEGAMVKLGDMVTAGQPIGLSGNTGYSSRPHLHFSVFQTVDGKKKLSLPFRLKTRDGIFTDLVRGREY